MKSIQTPGIDLRDIKNKVLNDTYIGIFLLCIPMVIATWLRIPILGMKPVIYIATIMPVFLATIFIFRKKIPYSVRAYLLILGTYMAGVSDLSSVGMLSLGALLLAVVCILAVMFLEVKEYVVVTTITGLTLIFIVVLLLTGNITYDFDIDEYIHASTSWYVYILTFLLIVVTVTMAIRRLNIVNLQAVKELGDSKRKIEISEEIYRKLIENSHDYISSINIKGEFIALNERVEKYYGVRREDVIGKKVSDNLTSRLKHEFYLILNEVVTSKKTVTKLLKNLENNRQITSAQITYIPVLNHDEIEMIIINVHDMSDLFKNEEMIEKLAYEDTLTELPNRVAFQNHISYTIEQESENGFIVCLLDVDNFKKINDSLGHSTGDMILKTIAGRLLETANDFDFVGRLSGDEFGIIKSYEDVDFTSAGEVAKIVQQIFSKPFKVEEDEIKMATSIGISIYPLDGNTSESLLKNADTALYEAKRCGRNDYRIFDKKLEQDILDKILMERELDKALEQNEIFVHYQPQWDNSGKIMGFEALMRWQSSTSGIVSPMTFIPILEESGKIIRYGRWILNEALAMLKIYHQYDNQLKMAVNVSSMQFKAVGFIDDIKAAIEYNDISPEFLELELTESVLIDDFEGVLATLKSLESLGISIALDDFGTGFSSLNYLRTLPISILKIDKSFVDVIGLNVDKVGLIIEEVIQLSHMLDLKVVAEGLEQVHQFEYLKKINCDYYQGYYLARPMASDKIIELLKKQQ